jgi:hypothetical protein
VSSPIREEKAARPANPAGSTTALWIRALLIFVAFGSFALLAADRVNATFSLWSRSIFVDFTHAKPGPPGVYTLQLAVPVDHERIFSSQIRLLDADQDKFAYTPRINSLFANGQGLFSIQKERSLLIAWATSPMALRAKGEGVLVFPVLFSSWIVAVALFLFSGSSVALFCCLPCPYW